MVEETFFSKKDICDDAERNTFFYLMVDEDRYGDFVFRDGEEEVFAKFRNLPDHIFDEEVRVQKENGSGLEDEYELIERVVISLLEKIRSGEIS